jgi:hypothetical protein
MGQVLHGSATTTEAVRRAIHEPEEVLVLMRKVGTRAASSTDRVDYEDTAQTVALRDEVRALIGFLAAADIDFVPHGMWPHVDPRERGFKRRFVLLKGDKGPRWTAPGSPSATASGSTRVGAKRKHQDTRRAHCRSRLRLDVCEASLRAFRPGHPEGRPLCDPRLGALPERRQARVQCLHVRQQSAPPEMACRGDGVGVGDDAEARADPDSELRAAILAKHPALGKVFGGHLGYGLMHVESRILIAVLTELMARGIVALPLHDGLLCAQSKKGEAAHVMRTKAEEIAGASIPVEEKRRDP